MRWPWQHDKPELDLHQPIKDEMRRRGLDPDGDDKIPADLYPLALTLELQRRGINR